ncbi:Cytochrome P450 9e2 [Eufriesea mexicana]|uniref:Cytochrome P450 9e2 n=2 Tax=Eufriesea mexicana TaxID=516756 RepID=A0A310SF39_9HYME|nr:Cytochrome P450 9e2 [Eufriesea mexicana]
MDFTLPNVLLRDPELIRDVSIKNFDHFTDHRSIISEDADPMFSKNVFSLRGERWRQMRNILTPSFTAAKMKFIFQLSSKCSEQFVDYLLDHPKYLTSIDARDMFNRFTIDVIASVAFGVNVNSMKDRENEFFVKGKDVFSSSFNSMVKLLALRFFPRLVKLAGITVIPTDTTNFFRKVIANNLKERKEQDIVRPDMLHLLTQAKDKTTTHELTIDDITSQAFLFFLGGSDSLANLLCYMVHELAVNPNIQERLHEEVNHYFEEMKGEISYETLSKMEYMDMVISETLRKYPSLVFIDRVCTKKFEFPPAAPGYDGAILYPDETIWIPVYAMHHDPKYFPEPEKFDPERFSAKNKDNIVPYAYLPFGTGPRKCIGDRFVQMLVKILMAEFLHKFKIKTTEKTQNPLVFRIDSFTPFPEKGFWIGLERRS